jgi:hypothetical protein
MDDRNPVREPPLVFAGLPPRFDIVAHEKVRSKTTGIAAFFKVEAGLDTRPDPRMQTIPRFDPDSKPSPGQIAHRTVAVILAE